MTTPEVDPPDGGMAVAPPGDGTAVEALPLPCVKDGRRHQEVRRYAQRLVAKVGARTATWIAAEIDEAVAELEHGNW
jgi:hypothetical protein